MTKKKSNPPTAQEIGVRIVRNIDRVHGFLDVLEKEIQNPVKKAGAGSRNEWEAHSQDLYESLTELRRIITESKLGPSQ